MADEPLGPLLHNARLGERLDHGGRVLTKEGCPAAKKVESGAACSSATHYLKKMMMSLSVRATRLAVAQTPARRLATATLPRRALSVSASGMDN